MHTLRAQCGQSFLFCCCCCWFFGPSQNKAGASWHLIATHHAMRAGNSGRGRESVGGSEKERDADPKRSTLWWSWYLELPSSWSIGYSPPRPSASQAMMMLWWIDVTEMLTRGLPVLGSRVRYDCLFQLLIGPWSELSRTWCGCDSTC